MLLNSHIQKKQGQNLQIRHLVIILSDSKYLTQIIDCQENVQICHFHHLEYSMQIGRKTGRPKMCFQWNITLLFSDDKRQIPPCTWNEFNLNVNKFAVTWFGFRFVNHHWVDVSSFRDWSGEGEKGLFFKQPVLWERPVQMKLYSLLDYCSGARVSWAGYWTMHC